MHNMNIKMPKMIGHFCFDWRYYEIFLYNGFGWALTGFVPTADIGIR